MSKYSFDKRVTPDSTASSSSDTPLSYRQENLVLTVEQLAKIGAPGVKYDQDKPDMSLLSNTALLKIAQVMTFGKKKYSAHNWRSGFVWSRLLAAAARHLYSYIGGEDKDPETGLSHLAHACCCLFMILEFEDTKPELDDRYKDKK